MMKDFGILGLNCRNLKYIKNFNPRKQIRLATDKHKMKEFLSQRGIPVPQTYAHITNRDELFHYDFGSFPVPRFVVKPNRGSQGKGIYIVKEVAQDKVFAEKRRKSIEKIGRIPSIIQKWYGSFQQRYYDTFYAHLPFFSLKYHVGKEWIDDFSFKKELVHTLEGQHRLGNKPDSILIEELIEPGEGYDAFCEWGLADIRVIAFNLVPIAAYVRVPTEKSGGKANLAQGGIALGIDVVTGRITTLGWKGAGKVFVDEFPDEYKHFKGMKVPFWDDVMLLSATTQFFVNIGYIGLDWVITKKGPQLLEVNGRSGIEIQNITLHPFLATMKKIEDMTIATPKKGVEIARMLFSEHKVTERSKMIYLSQKGVLTHLGNHGASIDVVALASIKKKKSYVSSTLYAKLGANRVSIYLPDSNIKATVHVHESDALTGDQIVLGTSFLEDYVVKAEHRSHPSIEFINPSHIVSYEIQDLQILDQNLHTLEKSINLHKAIAPTNYLSELDTFVSLKGKYNPQFTYNYPSERHLRETKDKLEKLYDHHVGGTLLQSSFAQLLYKKMHALSTKLSLVQAYKKQDLDGIALYNREYFGSMDSDLIALAEKKGFVKPVGKKASYGRLLQANEAVEYIDAYIKNKGIVGVSIEKSMDAIARISVNYAHQKPTIMLSGSGRAVFREKELEAKLAHEVDVHLQRYLNGKKTGWYTLMTGTANYLSHEEGLAVWMAGQVFKRYVPDYHNTTIYEKYYYIAKAQSLNFRQLVSLMKEKSMRKRTIKGLFLSAMRLKKGTQSTTIKHPGTVYTKDKVYLEGYTQIESYVANGGVVDVNMMSGKIRLDDRKYIF